MDVVTCEGIILCARLLVNYSYLTFTTLVFFLSLSLSLSLLHRFVRLLNHNLIDWHVIICSLFLTTNKPRTSNHNYTAIIVNNDGWCLKYSPSRSWSLLIMELNRKFSNLSTLTLKWLLFVCCTKDVDNAWKLHSQLHRPSEKERESAVREKELNSIH